MLTKKRQPAQAAVEFAMVIMILLVIILGIIEIGHLVFVYASVLNAAREAARYGAASGLVNGNPQFEDCTGIANAAVKLKLLANFSTSNVNIYYDQGPGTTQVGPCSSMSAAQWSAIGTGSRVKVTINSPYSLIVPIISLPNAATISASNNHTILGNITITGTVVPPPFSTPTITSITPSSGPLAGGTTVTIAGTYMTGAFFRFGNNTASCSSVAATQATCTTPPGDAVGPVTIAVSGTDGVGYLTNGFTYLPPPTFSSINPASGPEGGGTPVTILGTNLTGGSVKFGGTPGTCTVVSDTQINCVTPVHTPGVVNVVINADGGTVTASGAYTYIPAPYISDFNPKVGPTTGGTVVVITGTNFDNLISVKFGTIAGLYCNPDSSTQITCTTPVEVAGSVNLVVTTPGGSSTSASTFTFYNAPTISPPLIPQGGPVSGLANVIINGSNLLGGVVTFDTTTASCPTKTNTQFICNAPAHAAGGVTVSITTPGGTSSVPGGFIYYLPPNVTSITPNVGPFSGLSNINIVGTYLNGGTVAVTFGGTVASCPSVSANLLICAAPAATVQTFKVPVNVVVTTSGGSFTVANGFTYIPLPTVTSILPVAGKVAGGDTVTITGTNLDTATSVVLGTSPSTSPCTITSAIATTVVCTTTSHVAGATNVTVTTPGGSASLTGGYTYENPPTIISVSPVGGPTASGVTVTITGTNFQYGTATFGGTSGVGCTSVSPYTTMTCTSPAPKSAGPVDVVVTTPGGSATRTNGFTYYSPPTLSSVNPTGGKLVGGDSVTITGTNLDSTTSVVFSGSACTVVSANTTTVVCTTTSHTAGAVNVTVTTLGGVATLTSGFTYYSPPTLNNINPNQGTIAGGTVVTITGTNFVVGSTIFTFDGASCTATSATSATCTTVAHIAAKVDVTVTTPGGSATKTQWYQFK